MYLKKESLVQLLVQSTCNLKVNTRNKLLFHYYKNITTNYNLGNHVHTIYSLKGWILPK